MCGTGQRVKSCSVYDTILDLYIVWFGTLSNHYLSAALKMAPWLPGILQSSSPGGGRRSEFAAARNNKQTAHGKESSFSY